MSFAVYVANAESRRRFVESCGVIGREVHAEFPAAATKVLLPKAWRHFPVPTDRFFCFFHDSVLYSSEKSPAVLSAHANRPRSRTESFALVSSFLAILPRGFWWCASNNGLYFKFHVRCLPKRRLMLSEQCMPRKSAFLRYQRL